MSLDILIVAYHAREFLAETLASVARWSAPSYRLNVYENSSSNYPLTWIWNRFFEHSSRPFIALLNPDILVGPGWDTEAIACMADDPLCAAAGPISNHAPNREILPAVIPDRISTDMVEDLTGKLKDRFEGTRFVRTEDYRQVCGHCCIIRREAWAKLGGFDERLPFAGNDYDFNERAVRAGLHLKVLTHALSFHHWNASTKDGIRLGTFDVATNTPRFSVPPNGATFSTL